MENLLKELNNILDEAEIKANKIKQLAEERKFKLQKVLDKIDPLADSLWDEIEKLYAENLKEEAEEKEKEYDELDDAITSIDDEIYQLNTLIEDLENLKLNDYALEDFDKDLNDETIKKYL